MIDPNASAIPTRASPRRPPVLAVIPTLLAASKKPSSVPASPTSAIIASSSCSPQEPLDAHLAVQGRPDPASVPHGVELSCVCPVRRPTDLLMRGLPLQGDGQQPHARHPEKSRVFCAGFER